MNTITTVFRCGSLDIPLHDERMHASFKFFDSAAPKGRVLRGDAIFASPEREALQPWIEMKLRKRRRSEYKRQSIKPDYNPEFSKDVSIRHLEVIVDDSLFVYNADLFGEIHIGACYTDFDPEQNDASLYWASGIPLAEWHTSSFAKTKAAESWEVLVGRHHILNATVELADSRMMIPVW